MKGYIFRGRGKTVSFSIRNFDEEFCISFICEVPNFERIEKVVFSIIENYDYENVVFLLSSFPNLKKIAILSENADISRLFDVLLKLESFSYEPRFVARLLSQVRRHQYNTLCELIEKSDRLRCLKLSYSFRKETPDRLLKAISKSKIEKVVFTGFSESRFHLKDVGDMIRNSKCLSHFAMSEVKSSKDEEWKFFCEVLENSNLQRFELWNNGLSMDKMVLLLQSLSKNKLLNTVLLHMYIDPQIVRDLGQLLMQIKHAKLYLNHTEHTDQKEDAVWRIGSAVSQSQSLRSFSCSLNVKFQDLIFPKIKESPNLLGFFKNHCLVRCNYLRAELENSFKRNKRNLEKTVRVCQILLAIKKFRISYDLQTLGRDMVTLLSKHLLLTWTDVESWSYPVPVTYNKRLKRFCI